MDNSKIGVKRNKTKTPALTKVAEWISADAGTGASIESGNHMWKPNWADFTNAAVTKQNDINSNTLILKKGNII